MFRCYYYHDFWRACIPVCDSDTEISLDRSSKWTKGPKSLQKKEVRNIFIVQGGMHKELQENQGRASRMDFDGYAIGGLAVGKEKN